MGILYHLARPEDAERIRTEGFKADSRSLKAWAQGVYLATDEQTAALYESLDPERERLQVTAAVLHPFVVQVPMGAADAIEVMHGAVSQAFGAEAAMGLDRETLRRERRSLAESVTSLLSSHGYDSLRVEMGAVSSDDLRSVTVGGNQLVVFDPERVTLLGLDLEFSPLGDGPSL